MKKRKINEEKVLWHKNEKTLNCATKLIILDILYGILLIVNNFYKVFKSVSRSFIIWINKFKITIWNFFHLKILFNTRSATFIMIFRM